MPSIHGRLFRHNDDFGSVQSLVPSVGSNGFFSFFSQVSIKNNFRLLPHFFVHYSKSVIICF